jgi:hypothetical protein
VGIKDVHENGFVTTTRDAGKKLLFDYRSTNKYERLVILPLIQCAKTAGKHTRTINVVRREREERACGSWKIKKKEQKNCDLGGTGA